MSAPPVLRRARQIGGYDDFLGLGELDLASIDLLVLTGLSGSGKTTALRFLEASALRDGESSWLCGGPIDWSEIVNDRLRQTVLVDELVRLRDLFAIARLLRGGHRVLCASHLPLALTRALGLGWRTAQYRTDRDPDKISRYLRRRGVPCTAPAVRSFVAQLGATFTDVDLVLERAPGRSFDRAWRRFQALDRLERQCNGGYRWWQW